MADHFEHLFVCFWPFVYLPGEMSFKSLPIFKLGVLMGLFLYTIES
jgi:hypothetical protein